MRLVEVMSGISVSSSFILHCTGIVTCKQIISKGNVGTMSHIPFLSAALMGGIWTAYGVMVSILSLVVINLFITVVQSCYFIIYYIYAEHLNILRRDALIVGVLFISPIMYCYYVLFYSMDGMPVAAAAAASHHSSVEATSRMDTYSHISFVLGMMCNVYTIMFFASPLSTMTLVIKSKDTSSMSFPLSFMSAINAFGWTVYGVLIKDIFVEVSNGTGFFLSLVQLTLFVMYPRKQTQEPTKEASAVASPSSTDQ